MSTTSSVEENHVVLLHGLSRTTKIMQSFANYLKLHGFIPHNVEYPSTKNTIAKLADCVFREIESLYNQEAPLHFVGHSMGAIIIRKLLDRYPPPNLGRVVMIAPPNHGSEVVDFLNRFPFFSTIYGPSFIQLAVNSKGIWRRLPKPNYEFGIIAGTKSKNFIFSHFVLPKPNDGKVSVRSTELQGSKDHLLIAVAHADLPKDPNVMRECIHFITHGSFYQ